MQKLLKIRESVFLFILLIMTFFVSCTNNAQVEWRKLIYHFNVGSLPAPYNYHYTITLFKDGRGELVYTGGYTGDGKNTENFLFVLDDSKLEILNIAVKESNVLNLDIKQRPSELIPDGGHSDGIEFYKNNGDSEKDEILKSVPSYPELKYEKELENLYSVIRKAVPDDVWKQVNSREEQ